MTFQSLTRYIILGLSILAIILLVNYFSNIVAYVLISWVLSLLGQPVYDLIRRFRIKEWRLGSSLSALLTLVIIVLVFASIIFAFVPLVIEQAGKLANLDYGQIFTSLEQPVSDVLAWLNAKGFEVSQESLASDFENTLTQYINPGNVGSFFGSLVSLFGDVLIGFFSILFITFFFLRESKLFTNFLKAVVPNKYENGIGNAVNDTSRLLTRYFGGIVLQITIITLFVSISLRLLGVQNSLLIGFFAALINVIPYLGPLLGAIFGIFITVSTSLDPPLEFYSELLPLIYRVILVFALVQLIDNFILQPYIFSNSVLAHPLEIFLVIMIGAKIAGIPGMILAIPSYTVLRVVLRTFMSEFKLVQRLTGSLNESRVH